MPEVQEVQEVVVEPGMQEVLELQEVHLMLLLECRAWQGVSLRETGLHLFHRDVVDLAVV